MRTAAQHDSVNRITAANPGHVFAWIEPMRYGCDAMEMSTDEGKLFVIEPDGRITDRYGVEVTP